MFHETLPKKSGEKSETRWGSGVYLGINETSQELIMETPQGAVKANDFRRKGSEEERWNMGEAAAMKGRVSRTHMRQTRIIVPVVRSPDETNEPDARPIVARGVAVEKSEYLAMGPTPGCRGFKALV